MNGLPSQPVPVSAGRATELEDSFFFGSRVGGAFLGGHALDVRPGVLEPQAELGKGVVQRLRRHRRPAHPQWHLDEMFVAIGGKHMYLWRAIDQNGEILDVLVQARRNKHAALRLMRKLLKKTRRTPVVLVTDKLKSYAAAFRDLGLSGRHHQARWKNNRIEGSHVYVRRRERRMQRFRSPGAAQRFLSLHAATYNTFNTRRHLITATEHRKYRDRSFATWREAAGSAA